MQPTMARANYLQYTWPKYTWDIKFGEITVFQFLNASDLNLLHVLMFIVCQI